MVPNYQADVERCAAENPEAWKNAHTGNAHTEDFIRILAAQLHEKDDRVGLNGKRGNPNDISDDALNVLDPDDGPGLTPEGEPCWVVDVIIGAGGPNPTPAWNAYTDPESSTGANVVPGPPPEPAALPWPSYEALGGDEGGKKITRQLEADYQRAGRPGLDGDCGGWQQRVSYDFLTGKIEPVEAAIAAHRQKWCDELGIPVSDAPAPTTKKK